MAYAGEAFGLIWQRRDSDADPSMLHTPTYAGEAFGLISHLGSGGTRMRIRVHESLTGIRMLHTPTYAGEAFGIRVSDRHPSL